MWYLGRDIVFVPFYSHVCVLQTACFKRGLSNKKRIPGDEHPSLEYCEDGALIERRFLGATRLHTTGWSFTFLPQLTGYPESCAFNSFTAQSLFKLDIKWNNSATVNTTVMHPSICNLRQHPPPLPGHTTGIWQNILMLWLLYSTYKMQPRDQTSTSKLWPFLFSTSGAM